MQATAVSGAGSTWAIVYSTQTNPASIDLSAYANGEIRFWANCSSDNFDIYIQHLDGSQDSYSYQGTFGGAFNKWVPVIFPLGPITADNITLTDIFSPFLMTANEPLTCYIDDIRYVNPPAPGAPIFTTTIRNISDGSPASGGITWTPLPPAGWAMANQYIDLEVDDVSDYRDWGVQIYTNNTSSSANPRYVVSGSSNPAGLVDIGSPNLTAPMAWSITTGTQTAAATAPFPADPNNAANPYSFLWIYMKDAATPSNQAANTTAFQNGDPNVTVKNYLGIHYAQGITLTPDVFGASNPPNYIFFEANFGIGLQNYQTNSLIIEYFTL